MTRYQYVLRANIDGFAVGDLIHEMYVCNLASNLSVCFYNSITEIVVYVYGHTSDPRERAQVAFDAMTNAGAQIIEARVNIYSEDGEVSERRDVLAVLA